MKFAETLVQGTDVTMRSCGSAHRSRPVKVLIRLSSRCRGRSTSELMCSPELFT